MLTKSKLFTRLFNYNTVFQNIKRTMPPKRKLAAPKVENSAETCASPEKRKKEASETIVETRILRTRKPIEETIEKPEKKVKETSKKEPKSAAKSNKKIVKKQEETEEETVVKSKPKPKKKAAEPKQNGASNKKEKEVVEKPEPKQEKVVKSKPKSKKKLAEVEEDNLSDIEEKETEQETEIKEKRGRGNKAKLETKENESEEKVVKKAASVKATKEKVDKTVNTKEKKTKTVKEKPVKEKEDTATPNRTSTDWEKIDFSCKRQSNDGNNANFKITSWNVDGLRAWVGKDCLKILDYDKPDILCLQETKCGENKIPKEVQDIEDYKMYWCSGEKDGYAGVALFSKQEPITIQYGLGIEEHDEEGRCITAEFEKFYVICVYVPNAGRKLVTLPKRLRWNEEFKKFVKQLDEKKPVIVCGDMNVAHNEIDLKNPGINKMNAGFTQEERDGMTDFLESGFVDSYRKLYPDKKDVYTFWSFMKSCRSKNVGWRLDYFLLSERIVNKLCDNVVHDQIFGSDHCPITLFMDV